jgi:hypothetical protein
VLLFGASAAVGVGVYFGAQRVVGEVPFVGAWVTFSLVALTAFAQNDAWWAASCTGTPRTSATVNPRQRRAAAREKEAAPARRRILRRMSRSPPLVAALALICAVAALAGSVRADLFVPPTGNAPKIERFVTRWPAVSPCAAGSDYAVDIPPKHDTTLRWSNGHGDELRLGPEHEQDTLSPALVRDPPTQLELIGSKRGSVLVHVTCRSGSIGWDCRQGSCAPRVRFGLDPAARAHYAARDSAIARAWAHPAQAPAVMLDEALWLLADTCAHRRCDNTLARKTVARLRAVRKLAPWTMNYARDGRELELLSPDGLDIINCVSSWCVIGLGGLDRIGFTIYSSKQPGSTWESLVNRDWSVMIQDAGISVEMEGELVR